MKKIMYICSLVILVINLNLYEQTYNSTLNSNHYSYAISI